MNAGYDLFLDRDTLRSKFFVADIFRQDSMDMAALEGRVDLIFAGSFFHLFDWDQQVAVAKAIVNYYNLIRTPWFLGTTWATCSLGCIRTTQARREPSSSTTLDLSSSYGDRLERRRAPIGLSKLHLR